MKVRLPLMVQDPLTSRLEGIKTTEDFFAYRDDFYDGPITERMAVIDLDPDTGERLEGVKFIPSGQRLAHYDVPRIKDKQSKIALYDIQTPQFKQAALLAMALKTLYLFEKKKEGDSDLIGRNVGWAFNAPQLLLIPRAGLCANAYYQRASHSIQFFSFPSQKDATQMIHTCLSRDIVAHETTHAIVDAIAPELYDAITPESLAIHEGLADLASAFMAFQSGNVAHQVLLKTHGKIDNTTAFSSIAEEFGQAVGESHCLRNLYNETTLADMVEERPDPHDLCVVFSGALYKVLVRIHEEMVCPELAKEFHEKPDPLYSASGLALQTSADILRQMVFGALDYLPPGDASFADFGRAIIAANKAMYPDGPAKAIRQWLKEEFVKRRIVDHENDLERPEDALDQPIPEDIESLATGDWAGYNFAENHRTILRLPREGTYKVWPRFLTHRTFKNKFLGDSEGKECIFKISWTNLEPTEYKPFPGQVRVTVGTTLVIDRRGKRGRMRTILSTDPGEGHRAARGVYLRNLFDQGTLKLDDLTSIQKYFPDSFVNAETKSGTMRVRGTARMLHIIG